MHTMHTFHYPSSNPLCSKGFHGVEGMHQMMHTARIPMHTTGFSPVSAKKRPVSSPDVAEIRKAGPPPRPGLPARPGGGGRDGPSVPSPAGSASPTRTDGPGRPVGTVRAGMHRPGRVCVRYASGDAYLSGLALPHGSADSGGRRAPVCVVCVPYKGKRDKRE